MHERPLSLFLRDRFVEMVDDIIGTDDAIAITDEGRTVAVVLDATHYAEMVSFIARSDG